MLANNATGCAVHAQAEVVTPTQPPRLVDYSPKDHPWDMHRAQAQWVEGVYAATEEFDRLAGRVRGCSGFLAFRWDTDMDTGESRLKLREARFCRVRHCPVCQWRRSLLWQARFLSALPSIETQHPKARWLFLTLTVENMPLPELRTSLQSMNQAWNRLRPRKEFEQVQGWIRTAEVTRQQSNDYAHPHFHALLMVGPGYFKGGNYIKQERWADLWRECLKVDYQPVVDIRAVKPKLDGQAIADSPLRRAVAETLKYSVKPEDMQDEWLLELTKQVHKLRFIATGGALKNILREGEETEEDLLLADNASDKPEDNKPELYFDWQRNIKHYTKR